MSSSYSAISGAASSIIQNFQIQNMLKETAQAGGISLTSAASSILDSTSSSKKLNETETCRICSILCTAEYCLDTTQQLEDKLKEKVLVAPTSNIYVKLDQKQIELINKKINFASEKDVFAGQVFCFSFLNKMLN